ncbi:MAG: sigma 54-interacting transcriptional regulator [Planctomycetes bacterium]|nr:sigma 54-interacting transcriptional regulator [Planctomycetota bacterium]
MYPRPRDRLLEERPPAAGSIRPGGGAEGPRNEEAETILRLLGVVPPFGTDVHTLALDLQPKLLRLLGNPAEGVRFFPVGSETEARSECLFVFASGEPLADAVEQGRFRQDLYYRIQAVTIEVLPLRERGEEVLAFFRSHIAVHTGEPPENIFVDSAASAAILDHSWPGNLRELFAKAEQALLALGYRSGQGPVFIERRHLGVLGARGVRPQPRALLEARGRRRAFLVDALRSAAPETARGQGLMRFLVRLEARLSRGAGLTAGEISRTARSHGLDVSSRQARAWLLRLEGLLEGSRFALLRAGRTRGKRYGLRPVEAAPGAERKRYQGIWESVVDWNPEWARRLLFYGREDEAGADLKEVQTRGRVYFLELSRWSSTSGARSAWWGRSTTGARTARSRSAGAWCSSSATGSEGSKVRVTPAPSGLHGILIHVSRRAHGDFIPSWVAPPDPFIVS